MEAVWRLLSLVTGVLNRALGLSLAGLLAHDLLFVDDARGSGLLMRALDQVLAHPTLALAGAAVLVVLELELLPFAAFAFQRAPERSYIESHAPGGTTRVALSALQRALAATAAQLEEVGRARVRVRRLGRHRYRVHVRYRVRDVGEAARAAERLRLVLKKRFAELVVLDEKDRVDFDLDLAGIDRVDASKEPPKRLPGPPDVAPPEGFRGPIYQVDGEPG